MKNIPKLVYKKDIFFLILIFCIVSVLFLIRLIPSEASGKKFAEIVTDGTVITRIELDKNAEKSDIAVLNGFDTKVVHEKGEVWIESCSCPDKLCVNMGKISNIGTSIICLPAKTVVRIVGETQSTESQTDAMTY